MQYKFTGLLINADDKETVYFSDILCDKFLTRAS